ncbi:MAG: GNAT family N-acetyltransferase [Clostridia bacterium]|nr:GNAT family N-acetyltransferase [Clostridia bacterium]
MVLKGERILLRPFKKEDAEEYFKIANDTIIKKYIPFASPDTIEECTELIDNYINLDFINDFYFVIEDLHTHQLIGAVLCFRTTSFTLDTSYFIAKNYRGNGFILETLEVFIDYLSKNTSYKTLFFMIKKDNLASKKIMKKLGSKIINATIHTSSYEYRIKSAN